MSNETKDAKHETNEIIFLQSPDGSILQDPAANQVNGSSILQDPESSFLQNPAANHKENFSTLQIGKVMVVGENGAIDVLRKDESSFDRWSLFVRMLYILRIILVTILIFA